jgi:hypothetical protein
MAVNLKTLDSSKLSEFFGRHNILPDHHGALRFSPPQPVPPPAPLVLQRYAPKAHKPRPGEGESCAPFIPDPWFYRCPGPRRKVRCLQGEIQRAILQSYPNPQRQGCPVEATIRNFATNPDTIKAEGETDEHGEWYHITHCSPCCARFLELRSAGRDHRRTTEIAR